MGLAGGETPVGKNRERAGHRGRREAGALGNSAGAELAIGQSLEDGALGVGEVRGVRTPELDDGGAWLDLELFVAPWVAPTARASNVRAMSMAIVDHIRPVAVSP